MFNNKRKGLYGDDSQNWQWSVSCDTDMERNCEDAGCDSEGICRCSRIVGVEIDSDIFGVNVFFECSYEDKTGDGLDRVLAHWFCRKNFSKISWGWTAGGGYYGEELERIYVENDNGFFNLSEGFENMSHKEKIEFLLKQEYGSVLPQVEKVKDWQLKAVFLSDVVNSLNTNLNDKVLKEYKTFCSPYTHTEEDRKSFQEKTRILAPLTLPSGGKYQVIDGRHRVTALASEYTTSTWVARPSGKKGRRPKPVEQKEVFTPVYVWIICPKEEIKRG